MGLSDRLNDVLLSDNAAMWASNCSQVLTWLKKSDSTAAVDMARCLELNVLAQIISGDYRHPMLLSRLNQLQLNNCTPLLLSSVCAEFGWIDLVDHSSAASSLLPRLKKLCSQTCIDTVKLCDCRSLRSRLMGILAWSSPKALEPDDVKAALRDLMNVEDKLTVPTTWKVNKSLDILPHCITQSPLCFSISYSTRQWIFEETARWLNETDRSVFLLTGPKGSGKSAIAAAIAKRMPDIVVSCLLLTKGTIHDLIRDISLQLCLAIPEFTPSTTVKSDLSWRQLYVELIREPLRSLHRSSRFIIIDGLEFVSPLEHLPEFVSALQLDSASRVHLLLTLSDEFRFLVTSEARHIDLSARQTVHHQIMDVELYLACWLGVCARKSKTWKEHDVQELLDWLLVRTNASFSEAVSIVSRMRCEQIRTGQLFSCVKKAGQTAMQNEEATGFSQTLRAYRDKLGRTVAVPFDCEVEAEKIRATDIVQQISSQSEIKANMNL